MVCGARIARSTVGRDLLASCVFGVLVVAGCSQRNPLPSGASDAKGAAGSDLGGRADGRRSGRDAAATAGRDYVVDKLLLPQDVTRAKQYGVDLDGNGTRDNALGSILAAMAGIGSGVDTQRGVTDAIASGKQLLLLRVASSGGATPARASVSAWIGKDQPCPKLACFSGTHPFKPGPAYPKPSVLRGTLAGVKLRVGPGTLRLELALGGSKPAVLTLLRAHLRGTVRDEQITGGSVAGALKRREVDSEVIPAVAGLLDRIYKDPTTSSTVHAQVGKLFDTNNDGTIAVAEVRNNDLIKTFLAGDVDVDHDGVKELSLGLGFHAVSAHIALP